MQNTAPINPALDYGLWPLVAGDLAKLVAASLALPAGWLSSLACCWRTACSLGAARAGELLLTHGGGRDHRKGARTDGVTKHVDLLCRVGDARVRAEGIR